jgi:molybdopterin/thiamine biosynthesis adenylyltransferase
VSEHEYAALEQECVLVAGVGGLGSWTSEALGRLGVGTIVLLDDDRVELSNLPRQLFGCGDVGKNKAHIRGQALTRHALFPLRVEAYAQRFQEVETDRALLQRAGLWLCLGDNNATRTAMCTKAVQEGKPLIVVGLARDASSLYCAVQEPGQACWACMFPHLVNDNSYPCNAAGRIDIVLAATGISVFAASSILCRRYRAWNLRTLFLDGSMAERRELVERNPACAMCGPAPPKSENVCAHVAQGAAA